MPRLRHVPVRFSPFLIIAEVVKARKEEVEVAETHEMDILGPHTSRFASSPRPVSTGQDINDEALLVISQVEGVTSILYFPLLSHPETITSLCYRIRGKRRP